MMNYKTTQKSILYIPFLLWILITFTFQCSSDDATQQTSNIITGSDTDVNSASGAATATTSVSGVAATASGANSSKMIANVSKLALTTIKSSKATSLTGNFDGTYYCNGNDIPVTTDQSKGSIVISASTMSGNYNYNTGSSDWNYATSATATYTDCQTSITDISQLKTWDGKSKFPATLVTLKGSIAVSNTAIGDFVSTLNSATMATTVSSISNSGSAKSTGFTITNTTTSALILDNQNIDITFSTTGNSTAIANFDTSSNSNTINIKGEGKFIMNGTVGSNTIAINWPMTFDFNFDISSQTSTSAKLFGPTF